MTCIVLWLQNVILKEEKGALFEVFITASICLLLGKSIAEGAQSVKWALADNAIMVN